MLYLCTTAYIFTKVEQSSHYLGTFSSDSISSYFPSRLHSSSLHLFTHQLASLLNKLPGPAGVVAAKTVLT